MTDTMLRTLLHRTEWIQLFLGVEAMTYFVHPFFYPINGTSKMEGLKCEIKSSALWAIFN